MTTEPAISTIESPGEFDGLLKAKPTEPIFPLLARDEDAPALVLEWVSRRRRRAIAMDDPEKAAEEFRQAAAAEMIAWAMEAWRRDQSEPDTPLLDYYAGPPDARLKAEQDRTAAMVAASRRLDNAVAEANETAGQLRELGFEPEAQAVEGAVATLKAASAAVRPRRTLGERPLGEEPDVEG